MTTELQAALDTFAHWREVQATLKAHHERVCAQLDAATRKCAAAENAMLSAMYAATDPERPTEDLPTTQGEVK